MAPSASIWEPTFLTRLLSDTDSRPRTNLIALAGATGTLIAALAALLSVFMIVLDEIPRHLECRHRFLVDAGRSPAARRWYGGAPWTVHRCRWSSAQRREARIVGRDGFSRWRYRR
jgi:hypothetical protein